MSHQTIKELLQIGIQFAGPQGYWRKLGLKEDPGLANLEFADFFEAVWRPSHKKSFLEEEGHLKTEMHGVSPGSDMTSLYKGLVMTTRVIGMAFFMYSVGCVHWHLHACRVSRKFKCPPNLSGILECPNVPDHEKEAVYQRSMALSVCAFTLYEGSGALGGYSAGVWELWSRIWGVETPLPQNGKGVAFKEAQECSKKFSQAEPPEQKGMFLQWLRKGYPDLPKGVDNNLWAYFSWVQLYQSFEAGWVEPEIENPNHRGAILAGFFRRAAKGYLVAPSYDLHRTFKSDSGKGDPRPLVEFLDAHKEDFEMLLTDHQGLSPMGQWILKMVDLQFVRLDMVAEIVGRGEAALNNPDIARSMAQSGLAYKMSQRGRTRFARIR